MRPGRRSSREAGGAGQGGLRSHSDKHLASASEPGLSAQRLGGMDGSRNPPEGRVGPSSSSRCGECGTPWRAVACLVPQKGKGSPSCPSCPPSPLLATDRRDAVKTSVCEGSFTDPLFTLSCQSTKHLEPVSKWSSDDEQMWIPLTFRWPPRAQQIYKHGSGAPPHRRGFHIHNPAATMSWQAPPTRAPRCSHTGPALVPHWPHAGPRLASNCSHIGPTLAPHWPQTSPKLVPHWPYAGPTPEQLAC